MTTLGGRYTLLRRIGSGGMGTVWEALDGVLGRRVAVKILSPALCDNETIAARFRREAQAAGRLTHPNIAQVFDYGEDGDCPFIVLELVPGSTLRAMLEERGPLPPREVATIGAQIADALAAAHAEGIVHRDVKPANVMVAPDGRVKVMDFGIADAVWFEPLTDTGTIMATARYISPEQATGGGATGASDVYSLGAVLYELFAGRLPFDGDSPFAIAHAHAYEVPEPLAETARSVPRAMREAVEVAMRKDARGRPTAAELATALRAAARDRDGTAVLPASVPALAATEQSSPGWTSDVPAPDVPARDASPWSSRAGVWVLAALAFAVIVVALVFASIAGASDPGGRSGSGRGPGVRTQTSSDAPQITHASGGDDGMGDDGHHGQSGDGGKAVGLDGDGGPGNGKANGHDG